MKTRMMALGAAAMLCSVAAWAGKPLQFPYGPFEAEGEPVADCGDFDVLTDYSVGGYVRIYLTKEGLFDKYVMNLDVPWSIYYNSKNPDLWLPGTAEHIQQWFHFNDAEELTHWVTTGAPSRVILPGYGPVFMGVGRVKFDFTTGEITFMAGQFDQFNENFDAICAALRQ